MNPLRGAYNAPYTNYHDNYYGEVSLTGRS